MKKISVLIALLFCITKSWTQSNQKFTVAFGSCNKQNEAQPLWNYIAENNPDVWVWLGDNIYGDSNDMSVIKAKYDLQLANKEYQKLIAKTKVIGTWDDHDFGQNDAGKEYPFKKQTQQLALDFLNVPSNSQLRNIEGLYSANSYQVGNKNVKFILLDGRYHRDSLNKVGGKNIPNETGDILGEQQWIWFTNELKSNADLYIIGCGIQFLAQEHPYEKWSNFPKARQKLLDLLIKNKVKGAILLSGDRHIGEFSKIDLDGLNFPLFDITSSGLTHSAINNTKEPNALRVGSLVNQKNFGLISFKECNQQIEVEIELKGVENVRYHIEKLVF